MKTNRLLLMMLSASMAFASCEGDKGDLGPAGPQGSQGPQGPQGPGGQNGQTTLTKTTTLAVGSTECAYGGTKIEVGLDANNNGTLDASEVVAAQTKVVCNGAPGTANVYYSGRMEVKDANWTEVERVITPNVGYTDFNSWPQQTNLYTDTVISYRAEILTPRITQQILDQGAVLYYLKDMTTPSNGKVYPYMPWDSWTVGVTNKTQTGNIWDAFYSFSFKSSDNVNHIPTEKLTLETEWHGSGAYRGATLNNQNRRKSYYAPDRILYNELKPKTNFAIRYIVIPGGVTGKNAPPVDLKITKP